MTKHVDISVLEKKARELLKERGVEIEDIAELVFYLQSSYHNNLAMDDCRHNVERVLTKREVQTQSLQELNLIFLQRRKCLVSHYKKQLLLMRVYMEWMKLLRYRL